MNNNVFGLFIDLIDFDQKLIRIELDIKKIDQKIEEYADQIAQLKLSIQQSKDNWQNLKKIVDDTELKIKDFEQQESDKKQRLDQVKNQKEYSAIKKEIEKIKQNQYFLEPTLIEHWNKAETAKKDYELNKQKLESKQVDLEKQIQEKQSNLKVLHEELEKLRKERQEKEKSIPDEWIVKYNVMRDKVSNPVVPVEGTSCSACFYHVTSQDMIDLNKNKLLQCKRCYRFLYIK